MSAGKDAVSLSVIIPSYNRAGVLSETLQACVRASGGIDLEILVVDDGSTDDTKEVVERAAQESAAIRLESVPHGGPGRARNRGADLASHDVLLFLGDDIRPADASFFRSHAEYHAAYRSPDRAMLGKIVWPRSPDFPVNFVMSHVMGEGGEQFGYAHLEPGQLLDWRFFYTANVSVKKSVVADWTEGGFNPRFDEAAWEDIEFAYRLKKAGSALRILYSPASVGTHHHPFTVQSFLDRQERAGSMAAVFLNLHPDAERGIGVQELNRRLRGGDTSLDSWIGDYMSVAEGIVSWARLLEASGELGSQPWHTPLLSAVFRLRFLEGYLASPSTVGNQAAGYQYLLEEVDASFRRGARRGAFEVVVAATRACQGPRRYSWARVLSAARRRVADIPGLRRLRRRFGRYWVGAGKL